MRSSCGLRTILACLLIVLLAPTFDLPRAEQLGASIPGSFVDASVSIDIRSPDSPSLLRVQLQGICASDKRSEDERLPILGDLLQHGFSFSVLPGGKSQTILYHRDTTESSHLSVFPLDGNRYCVDIELTFEFSKDSGSALREYTEAGKRVLQLPLGSPSVPPFPQQSGDGRQASTPQCTFSTFRNIEVVVRGANVVDRRPNNTPDPLSNRFVLRPSDLHATNGVLTIYLQEETPRYLWLLVLIAALPPLFINTSRDLAPSLRKHRPMAIGLAVILLAVSIVLFLLLPGRFSSNFHPWIYAVIASLFTASVAVLIATFNQSGN